MTFLPTGEAKEKIRSGSSGLQTKEDRIPVPARKTAGATFGNAFLQVIQFVFKAITSLLGKNGAKIIIFPDFTAFSHTFLDENLNYFILLPKRS